MLRNLFIICSIIKKYHTYLSYYLFKYLIHISFTYFIKVKKCLVKKDWELLFLGQDALDIFANLKATRNCFFH